MSAAIKVARARSQGSLTRTSMGQAGGLLGTLGTIAKGALGFVTGGPVGAVAAVAPSLVPHETRSGAMTLTRGPTPSLMPMPGPPRLAPSVATASGPAIAATNGKVSHRGYHLNRSAYFLKDGTFVPEGSRWVKNRRRNPLNARALRRAVSRIDAGKVWQSKLHEIETGKYTKAGKRKSC